MINIDRLLPAFFNVYQYEDDRDVYEVRTIFNFRNSFRPISVYLTTKDSLVVSDAGDLQDALLDLDLSFEEADAFILEHKSQDVGFEQGVLHIESDDDNLANAFNIIIQNIITIYNRAYEKYNQPSLLSDFEDDELYFDDEEGQDAEWEVVA